METIKLKTLTFKLFPVFGTELTPIHIKGDTQTYYKFLTAQLITLKELRYMSKHGVIQYV